MIILYGKTASGKDAVLNKMVYDYGYQKIVTYTTRPKRDYEVDNVDYHFCRDDEFDEMIQDGFFAEYKQYHTATSIWWYGTSKESLLNADENSVIILTPDGVKDVMKLLNKDEDCVVLYIYANNRTMRERLLARGDDKAEAERRIVHDNEDFKGTEGLANRIFYNNYGRDLDELVESIVGYIQGER